MDFCSIASGSSGNCIYVGDGNTHLIVDAGISGKRIENGSSHCRRLDVIDAPAVRLHRFPMRAGA